MCGIAGFIQARADAETLTSMLRRIAHRGPDGEGTWNASSGGWSVSLGHRRLAIIDLETGAQPMSNEDGSWVVTYNGEVYNYVALRRALELRGRPFRTKSDTEVLLQQVAEKGVEGLAELNGMFAFAAWDARAQRLVLARDRMGIKPLYYAELPDGGLVFASELSALMAHDGLDTGIDPEAAASYLFSDYIHPPRTIIRGAKKLAPGHALVWRDGVLEPPRAFWSPRIADAEGSGHAARAQPSDQTLSAMLWRKLGDAVESQLVADVPVGVFLSGGLDSSSVAALAAARAGRRIQAFSIGFDNASFDESEYAALVARRLGLTHVAERLTEQNLVDIVDQALDGLDEPLADPSFLPTFLLSRLAAKHVKVVLGGDGGDELWGGYPTYRAHRYAQLYGLLPASLRTGVMSRVVDRLPIDHSYQSLEWKLRRFTQRWDDDPVRRHLRWMSSVDLPDLPAALPGGNGARPTTLAAVLPATRDALERVMLLDLTTYMPGSVLTKVDRAAMLFGLEVRPPMLDNDLVEFSLSLPSRYKLRGSCGKYLLKAAARGSLPDRIIDRPKKGFGIPLAAWLRGPLRQRMSEVVSDSPLWETEMFGRSYFRTCHEQHQSKKRDHSKPLWALLVLDHWYRRAHHRALGS